MLLPSYLPPSAPLRRLPSLFLPLLLLLLIATSTCDGGSGDAQKEAPATLAPPEASSKDDVPPTGLEPAVSEGGGHEEAEAMAASAAVEATTKAGRGGVGARNVEARRRGGGGAAAGEATPAAGGRGRRRHADYSTRAPQWSRPQAHSPPHTMSQSLYDHFRPLDPELPSGDLLPFLQFGMKLPVAPTRVKTLQASPTTTASPPRSTTFPSASTNALTEEREETDNDMAGLEEGPQSRTQAHSTRATSKLKAAILLQMMVNNVKRKKLALRGNLRAKEGAKERTEDAREGGRESVGEWGVRMGGERAGGRLERVREGGDAERGEEEGVRERMEGAGDGVGVEGEEEAGKEGEEEVAKEGGEEGGEAAPNTKRRVVLVTRRRKKTNGEEEEDSDVTNVDGGSSPPDQSADVLQNDAPANDAGTRENNSFHIPSEMVGKELKVVPAPETESTEDQSDNGPSNVTAPTTQESLSLVTSVSPTIVSPKTTKLPPITSTTPFVTIPAAILTSTTPSPPPTPPPPPPSNPPSPSTPPSIPPSPPPTPSPSPTPPTPSPAHPSTPLPPVTTTTTTTAPTSTSTQSTTTVSSTPITSSSTTSTTPPTTTSHRIIPKARLPQYPTLLSSQSLPSASPNNSTRTSLSNLHPLLHREHHRPPHLIFVPPSLRPPIPRRTIPFPVSTPAKKAPPVTTSAPSSSPPAKKELPLKAEVEGRDWVAVTPPNTTSSPSGTPRTSTHKSPPANPSPTKPHPNGVEKGWQRPYHPSPAVPPQSFQPFIPIEHHFSLPWHPGSLPYDHRPTSQSPSSQRTPTTISPTTEREVLSVVTSVSVESSPKLSPASSTVASKLSTPSQTSENNSTESESSGVTEDPSNEIASESYPSQFPHLVSVFVEDNADAENSLGVGEEQDVESDPEVVVEPGMGTAATYVLLSLAIVPGVVAVASATRCLLLHRKKSLYESETSSEVSCMGGRTLKRCSRGSQITRAIAAEESSTVRPGSDVFRVITRLPRVAHLGWEHERRRQRGKGGRADGGMLEGEEGPATEEENSTKEAVEVGNWEFPRSKLRLQTLLGQGNFGQVWKAEADGICDAEGSTRLVAVKLVKVKEADEEEDVVAIESPLSPPCTATQSPMPPSKRHGEHLTPMEQCRRKRREEFMAELGIMQLLSPPHPNVVTLLGCCTTTEPPLLIMEYVMFGKLLTFLREHRCKHRYANVSDDPEILTSRDLLVFAYCVIKGMEYLMSKGVVHRDLAARNILVDHNKTCKIADFGMSRCVRDTGGQIYEAKQKQGALPVRWMAPESLFRGIFTHKSDVWSFGVLLWEIITLGSTPYPGIGARDVMRRVRDGHRLERPSHVRPEIFRVAARCWHRDPSLRPTISRLRADMGPLLASASSGISRGSSGVENEMCLVSNRANRRWRPPGPQIDLNQFEDDSG